MFSNLTQNSILYIWDLNSNPKVFSGMIERVSLPRPKYTTFNPNFESVVDIIATINGERREFKDVPNSTIADFGENSFVLAENKDILNSYITSKYQNASRIIENAKKEEKRLSLYEESLEELNPTIKANKENDKAITALQDQVSELKSMIATLVKDNENSKI